MLKTGIILAILLLPLATRAALAARMAAPEVVIRVDLGRGEAAAEAFGCDLTERYVIENSAYST